MALSPCCAAVSAAVIPAPPLPTTTTSPSITRTGYSYRACCGHNHTDTRSRNGEPVYDVVVVGLGAAGACAAIEAAESGASVLVLERFTGGGATAISGGIVYAGGGTAQQHAAGITDTPAQMYDYLRGEVRDAVSPATLRRFCEQSAGLLDWLARHGVPFDSRLCPYKTSYPTNRHYLYVSDSERPPVPRGHRTHARGASGGVLYARLADAARTAGAGIRTQTRAHRLIQTPDGRVTGVECRTLAGSPIWARLGHRLLHRWSVKPGVYLPALGRTLHRAATGLENRYGRPMRVAARSVVLTTGGFVFNRDMMREHAPAYRGGLRLGTPGDDGSGIRLGTAAGGGARHLDRVTVWRFLTPPSALLGGILVDRDGRRVCDESRYGAAIGDAVLRSPGGRAWLLVDADVLASARRQVREQTLWFQRLQAWRLLSGGRVTAPTLAEVAHRAGVDPDGLAATLAAYRADGPDPAGKPADLVRPLTHPPFSLIDVSIRARGLPAPMLTLGGLTVDEDTGAVLRPDDLPVPGLYAAGRTAVGICSGSYVSGLSLADCVFSARRAATHAATHASPHTAATSPAAATFTAASTPAASTPAASTPAASTPAGSAPAASTPAGSAPAGSAPAGSAPAASTPAGSAPAGSAPAGSATAGSAPGGAAPAAAGTTPAAATPPVSSGELPEAVNTKSARSKAEGGTDDRPD
ncbi:FAD-binding protein [Actinoplanes sp. NPDC024001]|uniref:FAD-binding protein n=1 Tax=Actinoplanes sp. NPDC024001 TaxID=3154598 RepID=UPI0033C56C03